MTDQGNEIEKKIFELLLHGLLSETLQNKQYFLERIMQELFMDKHYINAKHHFKWDEGIAP